MDPYCLSIDWRYITMKKNGNRVVFAALGFALAAAAIADSPALPADRRLALFSLNSRKSIDVAYCQDGFYDPEALSSVDGLLRSTLEAATSGRSIPSFSICFTSCMTGWERPVLLPSYAVTGLPRRMPP